MPPRIAEWVDWLAPTLIGKDATTPATAPHPNGLAQLRDSRGLPDSGAAAMNSGQLHLPDRPGLGIELAEEVVERYPYIEGHYALTVDQ